MIRIIGIVLMAIGVVLLVFGYQASQSLGEQLVEGVTGRFSNNTMAYIVGGFVAILIGAGLALWGGRRHATH